MLMAGQYQSRYVLSSVRQLSSLLHFQVSSSQSSYSVVARRAHLVGMQLREIYAVENALRVSLLLSEA